MAPGVIQQGSSAVRDLANVWVKLIVHALYGGDAETPALDGFLHHPLLVCFMSCFVVVMLIVWQPPPTAFLIEVRRVVAVYQLLARATATINQTDHRSGRAATGCWCW